MGHDSNIRVEIIDRSAFGRAALPRLVEADPQLKVIGLARDYDEGLSQTLEHDPDIVLLSLTSDSVAPLRLLDQLMARAPRPVILLTQPELSLSDQLTALEAGALTGIPFDVRSSPLQLLAFQSLLASRIKLVHAARGELPRISPPPNPINQEALSPASGNQMNSSSASGSLTASSPASGHQAASSPTSGNQMASSAASGLDAFPAEFETPFAPRSGSSHPRDDGSTLSSFAPDAKAVRQGRSSETALFVGRQTEMVVFGAGLGGVSVLRKLIEHISHDTTLTFLAVLQLPEGLHEALAERLNRDSAIRVKMAREGEPLRAGLLQLAPPGKNLSMVRTGRIPRALVHLTDPQPGMAAVPSINVTMRACASVYGAGTLGIILNGISTDGLSGLQAIKARGGSSAVLNFIEAIVANTNRHCLEAGLADDVLSAKELSIRLSRLGCPPAG